MPKPLVLSFCRYPASDPSEGRSHWAFCPSCLRCTCRELPESFSFSTNCFLSQCSSSTVSRHSSVLRDNQRCAVKNYPIVLTCSEKHIPSWSDWIWAYFSTVISAKCASKQACGLCWVSMNKLRDGIAIIRLRSVIYSIHHTILWQFSCYFVKISHLVVKSISWKCETIRLFHANFHAMMWYRALFSFSVAANYWSALTQVD